MPIKDSSTIYFSGYWDIPENLISDSITDSSVFKMNFREIRGYYRQYKKGCDFPLPAKSDYVPSSVRFKKAADLINKEARFMFAKTPEVTVKSTMTNVKVDDETLKNEIVLMQTLLNKVLDENAFGENILKAAKDCAIGERIAMVLNFNEEDGITLSFLPSLNFVFEVETGRVNKIKRFIGFVVESTEEDYYSSKRIFKKEYYMENGYCTIEETVLDESGAVIEDTQVIKTKLKHIPVAIVRNDGLLGDIFGESEMEKLSEYESLYSKTINNGMDAQRMSMNPIRYVIDASYKSTKNLSIAPGSMWDIQSDQESSETKTAQVGVLETSMNFSGPLKESIERIRVEMFDALDMPDISLPNMAGVITSGKALKSIYWGLIVRCEEKMKMWKPALRFICEMIIEGTKLFPKIAAKYITQPMPINSEYAIVVENQYPIQEDELEEKATDITEVNSQLMSRKAYMMKWRGLTEDEAEEELAQIAKERQLLEDSFGMPPFDSGTDNSGSDAEDDENITDDVETSEKVIEEEIDNM